MYFLRSSRREKLAITLVLVTLFAAPGFADEIQREQSGTYVAVKNSPRHQPTKTFTSFSPALRCMDEVFLAHGIKDIAITSAGIPDETGKIAAGTKEMLISAITKMSLKSNAFEFIDFHGTNWTGGDDLSRLFDTRSNKARKIPDYYIRGSITQKDDGVVQMSKSGSLSASAEAKELDLVSVAFGSGTDRKLDALGMDMSIGSSSTRRILAQTVTSNTMILAADGQSSEGTHKLGKVGLFFNMDRSQTEGVGAATRALLELGLIETLGKFTQTPYWRCLDTDITNPIIREQALDSYEILKEGERILFVQRKLGGTMNRYQGPLDGRLNAQLAESISTYQAAVGLIANGQINFELYASLLDDVQNTLVEQAVPKMQPQLTLRQP